MSEKVEKKIVELDFDNEKFKRGISETLNGMKKLDGAFDFSKGVKGINKLDKAIEDVDATKMVSGIDKVKAEFSLMGAVAFSAIQKITNSIMDMGFQAVNSFTLKPVMDGFEEYTLKMDSIKTIQTNTMGAFSNSDEQLEAINSTLADLNKYADRTIYNFAQMTRNIGTFTAAGVGLEESSQAIQGISNLAAASGSNAQQASTAMYQLSQALSSGTLKLMDWRSVINAGMGGQLFQNALLRTSEALGTGGMDAIEKQGSFNESLQEGWATAEVLTKTLRNMTLATNEMTDEEIRAAREMLSLEGYSDDMIEDIFREANAAQEAATKVKSFQQLIDTTREALGSGWAQSWEYIIGDIKEAENLFTGISETINGVISKFDDYRNGLLKVWHDDGGRTDMLAGLRQFASFVEKIIKPIQEAFGEVFKPITGSDLLIFSENFKKFFTDLNSSLDTEAGKNFLKFIHDFSKGIFEVIDILGHVAFGSLDKFFEFFGKINSLTFNNLFGQENNAINGIVDFLDKIKNALKSIGEIDTSNLTEFFSKIKETLGFIFTGEKINPEEIKGKIFELEGIIISAVGAFIAIKTLISRMKDAKKVSETLNDGVEEIVENITGAFTSFSKNIKKIGRAVSLRNYLVGIAIALVGLAGSMYLLKDIDIETILPKLGIMMGALVVLVGLIKILDKMGLSFKKSITGALSLVFISGALIKIAEAVNMISMANDGDALKTLEQMFAIVLGIIGVSGALILVSRFGQKILRSMLAIRTILDAFMGIAITIGIMSITTNGDAGKALDYMMVILTGIAGVAIILAGLSYIEKPIIKAGGAISGVVSAMLGISIAIGVLSLANNGDALRSLQQLGVILLGLVGVASVLIGLGKFGNRMISSAFAIDLIVTTLMSVSLSIAVLSLVNGGDAFRSLQQLGVIIIALIGVASVLIALGKFGNHMISAAFAVDLIITALMGVSLSIAVLSLVNGGDALRSMQQMSVIIVALAGIASILILLGKFGSQMVAAGFAIDLIMSSLIGVAISLGILSLAFGGDMTRAAYAMAILAVGLGVMAIELGLLSKLGPQLILGAASLTILSLAILALSVSMGILSTIPFLSLVGSVIGLGIALLAFAGISILLEPLVPIMISVSAALVLLGIGFNLIAIAMFTFTSILTAMASMSISAFTNIADGIVAFSDRIAAGGDSIVKAAQVMGEALAASISAFFGRIITDIGNGISDLAKSLEGKEGEVFEGARSISKAIIAGLVGGLVGLGEALLGGIVTSIGSVIDKTSNIMAETGTSWSSDMAKSMADHPEWYVDAAKKNMETLDKSMKDTDAGKEAGEKAAENTSEGYEENLEQNMGDIEVGDAMAAPIENADTTQASEAMSNFFGEAFSPEMLQNSMKDLGADIPTDIFTGILDGSKGIDINPVDLLNNMGLNKESFTQNGTDIGKELGLSIGNGAALSMGSSENLDAGVNSQVDSIRSHSGDYENVGRENGFSYSTGMATAISESGVDSIVSNAVAAFSSGIQPAGEVGAQTGREYGARQIEAISSMGTVIAMTVKTNLLAAADDSDPVGAGNLVGSRQGDGTVQGIQGKTGEVTNAVAESLKTASQNADPGGKGDQAGTWFANGAQYGVKSNIGGMSATVADAFRRAASDSDPGGKGSQAGEWFDRGMATGIDNNIWYIREAAARAARAAKAAADAELDAHSPSREMMKRGRWFDEGIAIGMDRYRSVVTEAAKGIADDAMTNTSTAMNRFGNLVDGIDWDADPVITPVLDLDSFRADAATMSSFMPDSQVVSANMINRLGNEATSMQIDQNETQNGTNVYVTLDWKAGSSANQMVSELADELKLLNLTGGK